MRTDRRGEPAAARGTRRGWIALVATLVATLLAAVVPAGTASANATGGAARCLSHAPTTAADFNQVFGNVLGYWQAGDVPHAYPLPDGRVLWILNDSYLNPKAPSGPITPDSVFVRNVAVVQTGACFEVMAGATPDDPPAPLAFLNVFEQPGATWWWAHGGMVVGDELDVFFTAMRQTQPPSWGIGFEPEQTYIATYDWRTLQMTGLHPAPNAGVHPVYGFSVASEGDWTYLFGNADDLVFAHATRDNFVARVPRGQLFAPPTYWDGSGWVADPALARSISTEGTWDHRMSVFHLGDRWLAIAKADDFFGSDLLVLEAPVAQGPWVITRRIPVPTKTGTTETVTYDGQAYPVLFAGDRIVVDWSNNDLQFPPVAARPSLYRPTFADVALGAPTQSNAICHGDQVGASGTPVAGGTSRFHVVPPARLVDTRAGAGSAPVPAGSSVRVPVAAALGVDPSALAGAVLNVTATATAGPGYLTAYPTGHALPAASNVNVERAGDTSPNLVTVATGTDGSVTITTSVTTHVVVDLFGWYEPATQATAGRLIPLPPSRLLDTRTGPRPAAGSTTTLTVAGRGGVPTSGAAAVVLNVTGTQAAQAGYVTVWGDGPQPGVSNLNLERSGTRANQVIVPVGADGAVRLFTSGGTHLVVDVAGWYTDATAGPGTTGLFVAIDPVRLLDSRAAPGVPGRGCGATVVLPPGVAAAVTNITLTAPEAGGYLTAWPSGSGRPDASTVNVERAVQTRPNHAIVPVGADGTISLYQSPRAHVIVDLTGWFT